MTLRHAWDVPLSYTSASYSKVNVKAENLDEIR